MQNEALVRQLYGNDLVVLDACGFNGQLRQMEHVTKLAFRLIPAAGEEITYLPVVIVAADNQGYAMLGEPLGSVDFCLDGRHAHAVEFIDGGWHNQLGPDNLIPFTEWVIPVADSRTFELNVLGFEAAAEAAA